ncbi:MAG: alpha-L-fucosidase [Proteobacteria bacterium]|nr:alpha-L-fucosidase [Pseudomonadota bacterium]
MAYQPDRDSLKAHVVPEWYHDAKLGIFIHWGLFSVPAWAPYSEKDIAEMFKAEGMNAVKKSPYAEWYLNTMQFNDYPTWKHHVETWGEDFAYDGFQKIFEEQAEKMNPESWADLFAEAGAQYVVMVTKHHDGYLLWPSRHPNPLKPDFHSKRDFVGELTESVRKKGMRMGYYYSGVFDWSFLHEPIGDLYTFLQNFGQDQAYADYAGSHFRELIDRHGPSILWNDIGAPVDLDVVDLIAHYYNVVEEGVVNDRWRQHRIPGDPKEHAEYKAFLEQVGKNLGENAMTAKRPDFHWDFMTPEYATFDEAKDYKWEATRGVGKSFGHNRLETEKDMLSADELIRYFVDIVSKNGNLLLNVGPTADGTIPEMQRKPLVGLGNWLGVNGEAVFGTRPWTKAEGGTTGGIDVRYTKKGKDLYAVLLDRPKEKEVSISQLEVPANSEIRLLGYDTALDWKQRETELTVALPPNLGESSAYAIRIRSGD